MTNFSELNTYHPSGRISWRLPVSILLRGLPVIAVLAWLYVNILMTDFLDPSTARIKLQIFLIPVVSFFFAVFCAIAGSWVVEKGHSRSIAATTVTAILLCLAFFWVRWLVVFRAIGNDEAMRFASSNPWTEFQMLWELAVTEFNTKPRADSPVVRSITWAIEVGFFALLITGFSRRQSRKPYSETAHCWAKEEKMGELFSEISHKEALLKMFTEQRINALLGMIRADVLQVNTVASEWFTLKLTGYKAEGNSQECWLDIEQIVHKRDNEGKIKTSSNDLVKAWILTHEEYAALTAHMNTAPASSETIDSSEATEKPTPNELKPAVEALEKQDFSKAIAIAEPYRKHSEILIRTDALRLCALGRSGQERWAEAYADYHELFELQPDVHNAMELATTSVMAGELLRSEIWFKRADELNLERQERLSPQLRTHFLSALEKANELAACKPHLDWLAAGYQALVTTDDHFVFTRGFPFFRVFLEKSLPILRASISEEETRDWYEDLRQGVDEEGKTAIDAFLKTI